MASDREFGNIINDRRLELGFSLGQLANRLGTTASKVRAWERGQSHPDEATIERLAEELDLDVDMLRASAAATAADAPDRAGDATAVVAAQQPDAPPVDDAPAVDAAGEAPDAVSETSEPVAEADAVDTEQEEAPEREAEAVTGFDGGDSVGVTGFDGDDGEGGEQEPTGLVATGSPEGVDAFDTALEEHAADDEEAPDPDAAEGDTETAADLEDDASDLVDLPTEAVPVVAAPGAVPGAPAAAVAVATAPPRTATASAEPVERAGMFAPIERLFRMIFDPKRRILFWIRTVLTLIVLLVLLRVLMWAVPEFFEALKDILDTIESTPTEAEPSRTIFES